MEEDTLWAPQSKVTIQLSCTLEFSIPKVNPVYFGNTYTYCHFKSTAEMYFLWIKSRIPSLLFQASFSHSILMLRVQKPFLIVPNFVSNHSTYADQIRQKLSHLQFQNLHWSRSSRECSWIKTGTGISA